MSPKTWLIIGLFGLALGLPGWTHEYLRWRQRLADRRPIRPDVLLPEGWRRWHVIPERNEAHLYEWRRGKWKRIKEGTVNLAELQESE